MDLFVCKNGNRKFLMKTTGPNEVNSLFSFWDVRELDCISARVKAASPMPQRRQSLGLINMKVKTQLP